MMAVTPHQAHAEIRKLLAEADEITNEYQSKLDEINRAIQEKAAALSGAALSPSTNGNAHPADGVALPVAKKRAAGRPKGSKNKATKAAAEAPKKKAPKGEDEEDSGLYGAIWSALSNKAAWKRHLPELPKGAPGLMTWEIYNVIKGEKLWSTKSKNPLQQVSQRVSKLRSSGKLERFDGRRYGIKPGASL